MARQKKYPDELMERGVRLVFESGRPVAQVARDLGVGPEVLRKRVRRAEADAGNRSDLLTSREREEIRKLRRENCELRRANEDTTHYPPRGSPGARPGDAATSPVAGSLA